MNIKVTKSLWTGAVVVHIHVVVLQPSDMVNSHIRDYGMTDGGCQDITCKHCPVLLSDKTHYTYSNSSNSTVFNGVVDQCS